MLGNLIGGLVDTEKMTYDTIQSTLKTLSIELKVSNKDFFVMIKPVDEEFNFKFYVYLSQAGKAPSFVREISIKEVLGKEEETDENET